MVSTVYKRVRHLGLAEADPDHRHHRRSADHLLVHRPQTPLGRAQRATEQDRKMAALLGIDVDRTISVTFIMGAALAAVAGTMYLNVLRGRVLQRRLRSGREGLHAAVLGGIGSLPGAVLVRLAHRPDREPRSAYFTIDYKEWRRSRSLPIVLIFKPSGILGRPEVERFDHGLPFPPPPRPRAATVSLWRCASRLCRPHLARSLRPLRRPEERRRTSATS